MRYIKITDYKYFVGKDTLEKQDLIDIQQGRADILIDTLEGKWFNASENTWEPITLLTPNN